MKNILHRHFRALKTTKNHWLRKSVGVLLVSGGALGFLPVLGYWMLPFGLALLAVDWPVARRLHRQLVVWWGRSYQRAWPPARRAWKTRIAARIRKSARDPDTDSGP